MNRHIYGLTFFLIIVKIHFLLYWAFFVPSPYLTFIETSEIPVADETSKIKNSAKNGFPINKIYSVFDKRKGVIETVVYTNAIMGDYDAYLVLRFFSKVKGQNEVYAESHFVQPRFGNFADGYIEYKISSPYKWIGESNLKENLYVTASLVSKKNQAEQIMIDILDESEAIPVLISHNEK